MERVGRVIIRTRGYDHKGNELVFDEAFFAHDCTEKRLMQELNQMATDLLNADDELVAIEIFPKQYSLKVAIRMCRYKRYRG